MSWVAALMTTMIVIIIPPIGLGLAYIFGGRNRLSRGKKLRRLALALILSAVIAFVFSFLWYLEFGVPAFYWRLWSSRPSSLEPLIVIFRGLMPYLTIINPEVLWLPGSASFASICLFHILGFSKQRQEVSVKQR